MHPNKRNIEKVWHNGEWKNPLSVIFGVVPAKADNGEVIPNRFSGALFQRLNGVESPTRVSKKVLSYGGAFADAYSMVGEA